MVKKDDVCLRSKIASDNAIQAAIIGDCYGEESLKRFAMDKIVANKQGLAKPLS